MKDFTSQSNVQHMEAIVEVCTVPAFLFPRDLYLESESAYILLSDL